VAVVNTVINLRVKHEENFLTGCVTVSISRRTMSYFVNKLKLKNVVFWDVSAATCSRWFTARGFFYLEDGGDKFLRNVG
jgi:hypothetical protein